MRWILFLMTAGCFSLMALRGVQAKTMNVLFIMSDDMRPQIQPYLGPDYPSPVHPTVFTPNLEKLSDKSLLLMRAYCQQAVCNPSRSSLLTSRRPDTTHVYTNSQYFREEGGNFTTIPQFFKSKGYLSIGMGKIFHPSEPASHGDDPPSWSFPFYHAPGEAHWFNKGLGTFVPVSKKTRLKYPLPDDQVADWAVRSLKTLAPKAKTGEQPFFLGVGFVKPHLPFAFPAEFLKYYPEESIRLPDNPYAPISMPPVAWSNNQEIRWYADIAKLHNHGRINETFPANVTKYLRRGYYSAVTYVDSLVGKVMDALEDLGLQDNTVVSFLGDHGWQLGEHAEWAKETNFEISTHAPLMIRIPGLTDHGVRTEKLTEFVDLFPTLVEAVGFNPLAICGINSTAESLCTEGTSLLPLIKSPNTTKWKDRVFSQYPRPGNVMGYSMRTEQFRYTEWVKFLKHEPNWTAIHGAELYDHLVDKEENNNCAYSLPYKKEVAKLSKELHAGWRALNIPP